MAYIRSVLKHINLTNIIDYMNNFNVKYILFINKAENGIYISDQETLEMNQNVFF